MRFGIPVAPATLALFLTTLTTSAHGQSNGRHVYDEIVAVVGDRVILASTIERQLREGFAQQDLSEAERRRAAEHIIREIAREEIWIQIGKVIGREDPVMFEQQIQAMVDEYMTDQVDKFGSFTRMSQELDALGKSWQSLADEQRNRILGETARSHAISQRFSDGFNLLVTPREMLEYFRKNPEQFQARESADLAWVRFTKSQPDAAERAAQAVAAWREEGISERDLAGRFGGVALPPSLDVTQAADDPRAGFLKEIARDAEEGAVADPIDRGQGLFVVKVTRKVSEAERQFHDPMVQNRIRKMLVQRRIDELELDILNWKAQQVMRWPPWILSTR